MKAKRKYYYKFSAVKSDGITISEAGHCHFWIGQNRPFDEVLGF